MAALKAIPTLLQIMKAFMKIWSKQQFKLINMSTNLHQNNNQKAKCYNMLSSICEIKDWCSWTFCRIRCESNIYGDTKPFIVITSGLFETLPDELIQRVTAHECGHIACTLRYTLLWNELFWMEYHHLSLDKVI